MSDRAIERVARLRRSSGGYNDFATPSRRLQELERYTDQRSGPRTSGRYHDDDANDFYPQRSGSRKTLRSDYDGDEYHRRSGRKSYEHDDEGSRSIRRSSDTRGCGDDDRSARSRRRIERMSVDPEDLLRRARSRDQQSNVDRLDNDVFGGRASRCYRSNERLEELKRFRDESLRQIRSIKKSKRRSSNYY